MANPYKVSEEKKKKAPGGAQEPSEPKADVITPAEPESPAEELVAANENDLKGLFDQVKAAKSKKPKKNSHTLYLSDSVWAELRKRSKKEDMSPSEYLDALLKGAFEL